MEKEIAIIIPAYNAQKYISDLIRTIYAQTYINLCKIIIVNDDEDSYMYNFLYNEFPSLDIIILKSKKPQSGPGAARNVGLKYVINQNIPFIVFADADDIFYSTMAIEILYNSITIENKDFIYTPFFQNRGGRLDLNQDQIVWLFGKIYRTTIIKNNNICFPETFLGEDQSFNFIYWLCSKNEKEINYPLYLQRDNQNSLTHTSEKASLNNYFLQTYKTLYNTFLIIKKEKIALFKFKNSIPERVIRMYLDYNRDYASTSVINIEEHNLLIKKIYQNIFKEWWIEYTQEDWYKAWRELGEMGGEIPYIGFMDFLRIMTER